MENQEIIQAQPMQTTNLAEILERVLDKGIVIAGDIRISLADVELLEIKIRLLVSSVDKAKEIGIDWWEHDPYLSSNARESALESENKELRNRLEEVTKEQLPFRKQSEKNQE